MRWAKPSTTAVLPTPASPVRIGLFWRLRSSTSINWRISRSRPQIGSIAPSRASSVKSTVYCASAEPPGPRPTADGIAGNGACAAWSVSEVELLRGLGCNVFVPDFTGYGLSGGKPSETGLYATATAAWKYLQKRPDIDHSKILTMGWSIGSAVAIDLASREPVAGLITISAFTRLSDAASHQFPWLPVRLLLKYRFDNASKLAAVRCPLLIIHGDQDTLVPPRMAETLADISRGRASRLTLRGAGHNTVFSVDYPALREALRRFIQPIADGVNLPADKR